MAEKPLLLTLGEPAGIGPDCVLLAYQNQPQLFQNIIIVAPQSWLRQRADMLGLSPSITEHTVLSEIKQDDSSLQCWNPITTDAEVSVGTPSAHTASSVIACIEIAAKACLQKHAAALITAPIEKAILRDAGFDFPGHTEFLAAIGGGNRVTMMLASQQLRVALLTTHVAIADVPALLTIEDTLAHIHIVQHDLQQYFGITSPRIALCGLNPHAGEQGHFGREEIDILSPAIEQAQSKNINIIGPLPADTLFSQDHRESLDAIICCYHDQALIPIKTLSFGDAVNITLGLPFIRTSVDHGTALSRAGSGKVSYTSLIEAIRLAEHMVKSNSGGTDT
ncbi:MAG: 4-hydroxythreonine-4-phosphate dehydrogenase PdxA [Mariprofundaceae bacterium]